MTKHAEQIISTATVLGTPVGSPVSLNDAKGHLRVSGNDDNGMIESLLKTVSDHVEKLTGRSILTHTRKAYFNNWPDDDVFELPYPPLVSVTAIKYKDTTGAQTTWANTEYIVDTASDPGRVVLGYNKTFPSTTLYPSLPIEIEFVCGYELANVPEFVKMLIKIGIEHVYNSPFGASEEALEKAFNSFLITNQLPRF